MKIEDVEGIGPTFAQKLQAAGVNTTDDLLDRGGTKAGRASLASASGLTETQLLEWVNHADLMRINGVGLGVRRPARSRRRRLVRRAGAAERGEPRPDVPGARRRAAELDSPDPVRGDGREVDRRGEVDGVRRRPLTAARGSPASRRPPGRAPQARILAPRAHATSWTDLTGSMARNRARSAQFSRPASNTCRQTCRKTSHVLAPRESVRRGGGEFKRPAGTAGRCRCEGLPLCLDG